MSGGGAGAPSPAPPEQEGALDLILFAKPCHWAGMKIHEAFLPTRNVSMNNGGVGVAIAEREGLYKLICMRMCRV